MAPPAPATSHPSAAWSPGLLWVCPGVVVGSGFWKHTWRLARRSVLRRPSPLHRRLWRPSPVNCSILSREPPAISGSAVLCCPQAPPPAAQPGTRSRVWRWGAVPSAFLGSPAHSILVCPEVQRVVAPTQHLSASPSPTPPRETIARGS